MEKIYKGEIKKLLPIFQAIAEGKTIQYKNGDWQDIDSDEDGLNLDILIKYQDYYRIKSEPKYRPFKDAEECWHEMERHQPFGWVKDRKGSKLIIENVDSRGCVEVYNGGACSFNEVFEYFIFVDGLPFGVKVEE